MGTREVNKMSRGQSQTKAQPGRRILGRCKEKERTNNAVLIDLDSSKLHDFIIVDLPESSQQNPKGSRVSAEDKDSPSSSVISIDDDDDSSDDKNTGNRGGNGGDQEKDATPTRESPDAEESDGDDCQFVKEKPIPVNLSKCKRTYSGRKLPGSRFGLSSDSESSSSESDSSDCEVMEGSSGNIREQWEQAASRKTMFKNVQNRQSGLDDHVGASGSFNDTPENKVQEEEPGCSGRGSGDGEEANRYTSSTENRSEEDAPRCSGSNGANNEEENLSTPTPAYAGSTVDPFVSSTENGFLDDLVEKIFQDSSSWFKTHPREKSPFSCGQAGFQHAGKSSMEEPSFSESELQSDLGINYGGSGLSSKDRSPIAPHFWSSREQGGKQSSSVKGSFHDEEEKVPGEHFQFKSQSRNNTSFNNDKARSRNKEGSEKKMDKTQVNPAYSLDKDKGKLGKTPFSTVDLPNDTNHKSADFEYKEKPKDKGKLGKTPFSTVDLPNDTNHKSADFEYKEKPISADPFVRQCNTKPCGETQVNSGAACFKDKSRSSVGETSFRTQHQHETGVIPERVSSQDEEKPLSESSSLSNAQRNDLTSIIQMVACRRDEAELALGSFGNTQSSELCASERDGIHDIQNDIIGGREKFKETDQYKRAVEEEWASRQRQLQIQAEEVQRLKKRKKAEAFRLLDMERRQKQRLEEMRETQKKDVETLNMKEQIRAEVRKELDKLEVKYHDMASVLRHLGIHVGGGLRPMPREVHTAYKQAMLRFHPDRASRTDIRHQVEAEEKFKLISRLKEKLLTTT